jgi:hypothetical protein
MATFRDKLRELLARPAPLITKTPAFQKLANVAENISGGLQKGATDIITAPINLFLPKDKKIRVDPFKGNKITRAMYGQEGPIFQEPQSTEASVARAISEAVPATVVGSQMLKAFKPTAQLISKAQKPLGQLATKQPFQNKLLQNLYSKGMLNVAEGLPYSAGLYLKNISQGEEVTGKELGTDFAFDLATGAIPFIGVGLSTLDKPIREGIEEGFQKAGKESVKDRALKRAKEPLTKSAKEALEQEKVFMDTMQKQQKDMVSIRRLVEENRVKLQDANKELSDAYKARKGVKGVDTPEAANVARAEIQAENAQKKLNEAIANSKAVSKANSQRMAEILQQRPLEDISTPKPKVPEIEDIGYKNELDNLRNQTKAELEAYAGDFNQDLLEQYEAGGDEARKAIRNFIDRRTEIYTKNFGKSPAEGSKIPQDRYVPRVLRGGSNDINEIVGFDYTGYSPYKSRTGGVPLGERELFYNSVDDIIDADIRAIEFEKNAIKEEAIRQNVPEEVIQNQARIYKELADIVHEKNLLNLRKALKKINPYDEMLKNAELSGIKVGSVEIDADIPAASYFRTDYDFIEKLGIEEAFEPYINYKNYVGRILQKTEGMDWRDQLDVFVKEFGWNDLYNKFTNIERVVNKMVANGENPERFLKGIYDSRARKQALEHLNKTLPTYKFTGKGKGAIQDRLNRIVKDQLVYDIATKSALEKGLAKIRRTFVGAYLGLKPRSALQNITELKRVLATTDSKNAIDAIKSAKVDKGEIFERFPTVKDVRMWDERIFKKDPELKNSLVRLADDGHEKAIDIVMGVFNKTEEYKNKVFLYAYEKEALEKGLKGQQVTDYVMKKFNKYAITGDSWNTPLFFKNSANKTLLQFSQYPLREITILADTLASAVGGNSKDWVQLLKFAGGSAGVAAFTNWAFNWGFQDSFMPMPFLDIQKTEDGDVDIDVKTGPIVSFINEIYESTKNYIEITDEEALKGERMSRYEKEKASKIPAALIPGGSQLRNMGLFTQDLMRGYRPTASGNVRAPQGTSMADILRGYAFGPYSTESVQQSFDITDRIKSAGVLDKNESQVFREIRETKGLSPAEQYYTDKMMGRTYKGKNVKDILGKKDVEYAQQNPTSTVVPSDVFEENLREDEMWKEINAGLSDKTIPKDTKDALLEQRLQKYGLTRKDWEYKEMKGNKYTVKQKVKWLKDKVGSGEKLNYVELYEKGILTESVAKEMERQGMTQDYKALMDKVKLSDPLEVKAQKEKIIKELAGLRAKKLKTVSGLLDDIYKVKRPKRKKVTNLIKASNAVGSSRKNYLKADTASMQAIIRKIQNV